MHDCEHAAWLHVTGSGSSFTFSNTGHLERLIEELPRPNVQYPVLCLLQGKRGGLKDTALKFLYPNNNTTKDRANSVTKLRLDYSTIEADSPVLFADTNNDIRIHPLHDPSKCHPTTVHSIQWQCLDSQTAVDVLLTRVVLPLCGAFVVFADDFRDASQILSQFAEWRRLGGFSDLPKSARPRLTLVYTTGRFNSEQLRHVTTNAYVRAMFPSITLFPRNGEISLESSFQGLRDHMRKEVDFARHTQEGSHLLFSARHLCGVIQDLLPHVSRTTTEAFDIIRASRAYSIHDGDIQNHLLEFLQGGIKYATAYDDTTTYIASSLLMDAYPVGCHLFAPRILFRKLYKQSCRSAFFSFYGPGDLYQRQCDRVEQKFCMQFRQYKEWLKETNEASTARLHANTAQATSILWDTLKSKKTCLVCLVRAPQHVITCGHSICDTCIKIYGKGDTNFDYKFTLPECILCHGGLLTVVLKPPTCGARILGIDGGGTRGVVPIEYLALMQGIVGSECRLADFFDLAVGTSAGGLIILSMFRCQWDIERCKEVFDTTVKAMFAKQQPSSVLKRVRRLLKGVLNDGIYRLEDLETCLKKTYGHEDMFHYFQSGYSSGQKVAVTATPMQAGYAQIFSNYNATLAGHGCERINDAAIWEAARATSAAPIFFPPFDLGQRVVRDGGLNHNCPVEIALCEQKHIWPELETPDLVVSLGTGTTNQMRKKPTSSRKAWLSSFQCIADLLETYLSSLDGERGWQKVVNQRRDEDRFYRFNIRIEETPDVDDLSRMDELRRRVHRQPQRPLEDVVSALLATSFYFELDRLPIYDRDYYRCEGSIRCRNNSAEVIRVLSRLFPQVRLGFHNEKAPGELAAVSEQDICSWCQRYGKDVTFYVRHPSDIINIFLKAGTAMYGISSFPNPVEWFVRQQNLRSNFGTADHETPGRFYCLNCDQSRMQQRKRRMTFDYASQGKRPRLK